MTLKLDLKFTLYVMYPKILIFQTKMDLDLEPLIQNDIDDNWITENSKRKLSILLNLHLC